MKHFLNTVLVVFCVLLTSCSKMDDNGDLGGNWQLTPQVYFSVYTNMVQWRDVSTENAIFMGYFRQSADSLFLTLTDGTPGIYKNDGSNDVPVTDAAMMPANIPVAADFGYKVVKLSSSELVLGVNGKEFALRKY